MRCEDVPSSDQIPVIGRALGLDVVSSHQYDRDGWSDEQQLRLAAEEGRCLVTRNRSDFVHLTVHFFGLGLTHRGILLVPSSLKPDDFATIAEALHRYAREHDGELPSYTIDCLAER